MSKLIAKNVFQLPKMNLLLLTTSAFLLALDVIFYKIAIGPAYFQVSFGFLVDCKFNPNFWTNLSA